MGNRMMRGGISRNGGFTLVETVVVLAIIAGLSVIAYAAFIPGYTRVKAAYDRDDFERQLLELPQRVRLSGRGGILTSRSGDNLPDDAIIAVTGVPDAEKAIEDWRVLRLSLPAGWRLRVAAPIRVDYVVDMPPDAEGRAAAAALLPELPTSPRIPP